MTEVDSFDSLPSPLDEIASVAGLDVALAIADAVGGTRVTIPAHPKADHWLVETVGMPAAKKVCRHFMTLSPEETERGARHIMIPRGPKGLFKQAKARFYQARDRGCSVRVSARRAGVHERTAFRWERKRKGGNDPDAAQLKLI